MREKSLDTEFYTQLGCYSGEPVTESHPQVCVASRKTLPPRCKYLDFQEILTMKNENIKVGKLGAEH